MSQTQNSGQNPEISEGHCDVSENLKKKNSTQQFSLGSFSAGQEIPHILPNSKVHSRVHKTLNEPALPSH